ncbi:MAG: MFS transporter [Paludibacteraceae bacterium]|nr:MFS transporter [Paludibacteraceae bacterium]
MENNQQKRSALTIITIVTMFFLYAMIAFVTNLAAPVGKIWENSFEGSTHATLLGMLGNMMNFAAYLFMGVPAGKLLQKIGYKKTALAAVVVGLVGIAFQWLSGVTATFVVYLLGAFICGFAVCMLNTVVNPMLNNIVGGGNRGNQLNMIGGTLNSLTGSLTPMFVGALVGTSFAEKTISDVNIVLYIAMAVFVAVFFILLFMPIAEPRDVKEKIVYERSPWAFRHFVLGTIAIFFYVGVEVGVPASVISYLSNLNYGVGFSYETATFVAGLYWLLMLAGRLVGSAIGGKVSSKAMVSCTATVAIALIAAAIIIGNKIMVAFPSNWAFDMVQLPLAAVLLILVGLCTSVMWTSIFNMSVEGLGKYTAAASGIFMMMVVGGGLVPLIQSAVADACNPIMENGTGFLISYLVMIVAVAYILFYALIGSKNVNKDIKVD